MFSGFDTEGLPSAVWPGGETEALTRIERHLERKVSTATSCFNVLQERYFKEQIKDSTLGISFKSSLDEMFFLSLMLQAKFISQ